MKKQLFILLCFCALSTNLLAKKEIVHAKVNGLVCDFCAQSLKKVFKKEKAVKSIEINLDNSLVTLHLKEDSHLSNEVIKKLIKDAGYSPESIRRKDK